MEVDGVLDGVLDGDFAGMGPGGVEAGAGKDAVVDAGDNWEVDPN